MARGLEMDYFQQMCSKARRLDEDLFVRASPGLYLLGQLPIDDDGDDLCRRHFTTVPAITVAEVQAALREKKMRKATGGRFLRKVAKTDRNPWRGRISVGRAPNNDVVLEHPSISKLHAHFVLEELDRQRLDEVPRIFVTDAGSRNGTRLNGTVLSEHSEVELRTGDRLMFGTVVCDLLTAQSLHRVMRSRLPGA